MSDGPQHSVETMAALVASWSPPGETETPAQYLLLADANDKVTIKTGMRGEITGGQALVRDIVHALHKAGCFEGPVLRNEGGQPAHDFYITKRGRLVAAKLGEMGCEIYRPSTLN